MPFELFHEKFREIADKEVRSITISNNPELPSGTYGLIESYCNELDCDCRRVFLSVFSEKQKKLLAVISFGWESKNFYAEWIGFNDSKIIEDLKGPILSPTNPQSKLAPKLLEIVATVALQDKRYIGILKAHYKLFREKIGASLQSSENGKIAI